MHCSLPFCCHGDTVNMMDFFHYKSKWKAEAKLLCTLPPDDTFRLVMHWSYQLFSALSYLHRWGISHKRLYGKLVRTSGHSVICSNCTLCIISFVTKYDSCASPANCIHLTKAYVHGGNVLHQFLLILLHVCSRSVRPMLIM